MRPLIRAADFQGVSLKRTGGRHGSEAAYEAIGEVLGNVCGVVFAHPGKKTRYIAGDNIWNGDVKAALALHRPEVVVLNCGDAPIPGSGSIILNKEDVAAVHAAGSDALLLANHM